MEIRNDMLLTPQIKKAIELGTSGLDVMHGQLKVLMLEAERSTTYGSGEGRGDRL
jgi:hypothetical protein